MSEHGLRMDAGGILALLDIDSVVGEGDRLDLAELGASKIAELLAGALVEQILSRQGGQPKR